MSEKDLNQVWQSALSRMRQSVSETIYERYLRDDCNLLRVSDGKAVISTTTTYVRAWLEDNLRSLVEAVLSAELESPVLAHFVVDEKANEPQSAEITGKNSIELGYDTYYQSEVGTGVVVLPAYFLRLMEHGDISPKALSLYVGFRQAVYSDWKDGGKKARSVIHNIPHYAIARFGMMGRASIFRELSGLDVFAGGLVERVAEPGDETNRFLANSNRYRVCMFPRLSQKDSAGIETYLREKIIRSGVITKSDTLAVVTGTLKQMAAVDPLEYLAKTGAPEPTGHCLRNIQEITRKLVGVEGNLPAELNTAAERVLDRIITAFGTVHITHYFLQVVATQLEITHPQAWAIIAMRDHCWYDYESKTQKEFAVVQGGLKAIARWVGVSENAVKGWLQNETPFSAFVCQEDTAYLDEKPAAWDKETALFRVRQQEPLFEKVRLGAKSETPSRKKCDSVLKKLRLEIAKSETPLNSLIKPLFIKPTTTNENVEKNETPSPTQNPVVVGKNLSSGSTPEVLPKPETAKSMAGKWDLNSILSSCGVSAKKRRELLATQVNPSAFVSWIIYGFSNRAQGLNDPIGNAIQNVLAGGAGAGGVCDRLAAYGSEKLIKLLTENLHNPASSSERAFAGFSYENKQELYLRLGGIAENMPARKPAPRPAPLSETAPAIAAIPSQPPPELEARAREIFRRSQ